MIEPLSPPLGPTTGQLEIERLLAQEKGPFAQARELETMLTEHFAGDPEAVAINICAFIGLEAKASLGHLSYIRGNDLMGLRLRETSGQALRLIAAATQDDLRLEAARPTPYHRVTDWMEADPVCSDPNSLGRMFMLKRLDQPSGSDMRLLTDCNLRLEEVADAVVNRYPDALHPDIRVRYGQFDACGVNNMLDAAGSLLRLAATA